MLVPQEVYGGSVVNVSCNKRVATSKSITPYSLSTFHVMLLNSLPEVTHTWVLHPFASATSFKMLVRYVQLPSAALHDSSA